MKVLSILAPSDLALDWDNSGLMVGSAQNPAGKIALALDAVPATVDAAIEKGCQVLLTHHPLIFKPLKSINTQSPEGRLIAQALAGGLTIISAHTNWDAAAQGTAASLAALLDIKDAAPLEPKPRDFYKLVVFVPKGHEEALKKAVFAAGAGHIGSYDHCFFQLAGHGGFRAPLGADPFIGRPGEDAVTDESRLEFILPKKLQSRVAEAIFASHPYREPAFEFIAVATLDRRLGFGLTGRYAGPPDFAAFCKAKMGLSHLKFAGPKIENPEKVALMPGSGGGYLGQAKAAGAQVLITGDVGYHQALAADDLGLMVIDAGHFETEYPSLARLKTLLTDELKKQKLAPEIHLLPQKSPWGYV